MKQGMREGLGYQSEILMPMYENLYVKQFVLYKDESINYYFQGDEWERHDHDGEEGTAQ